MLDASKFGILGARGTYVLGGPSGFGVGVGTVGGFIPVIFATASYEGQLQRLPSDEARRAQIGSDMKLTNREAEAAITTMHKAITQHEARVAKARTTASEGEMREAAAVGRQIVEDIELAEDGLRNRQEELLRPLRRYSPPGQYPDLDAESVALEANAQKMQEILVSTRSSPLFVET